MALQSQVYTDMAPAVPGMPASVLETHYTAETHITASAVTVGNFVFADATDPTKVNQAGTGMVRGLVVYTRAYVGNGASGLLQRTLTLKLVITSLHLKRMVLSRRKQPTPNWHLTRRLTSLSKPFSALLLIHLC